MNQSQTIINRLELAVPAIIAGIFAGLSALFLAALPTVEKQNFLIQEFVPTEAIVSFIRGHQQISVSTFMVSMLLAAVLIYRWARVQRRVLNYTRNLSEFHFVVLALICGSVIGVGCLIGLQQVLTLQPAFQMVAGACLVVSWMAICVCTFPWIMPLSLLCSFIIILTQFLSVN